MSDTMTRECIKCQEERDCICLKDGWICQECLEEKKLSDCCKSKMTISGDTTYYYSCNNCGKPCDVSPNWTSPLLNNKK